MEGVELLEFDKDGFLTDPMRWDRLLAEQIAGAEGIDFLSEGHWAVIQQLRDHYFRYGALLPVAHVCRMNQLDAQCVATLFRSLREAWRVSGLPNPGEAAERRAL